MNHILSWRFPSLVPRILIEEGLSLLRYRLTCDLLTGYPVPQLVRLADGDRSDTYRSLSVGAALSLQLQLNGFLALLGVREGSVVFFLV